MFIIFGALSIIIFKSIFKTLLAAAILSYITYPVFSWIHKRLKRKTLSALIVVVLLVLVLVLPSAFVLNALWREVFGAYLFAKQYIQTGTAPVDCDNNGVVCKFLPQNLREISPQFKGLLNDALGRTTSYVFNRLTALIFSISGIMLHLFVTFFTIYYLLKDGPSLISKVKRLLPLKKQQQDELVSRLGDVTYAVVYGNIVVAFVQGVLAGVGFYLFGIPSPIIWGIVTFFISLIPFLGAAFIWLPAAIVLLLNGYLGGSGITLLRGAGLFFYGLLIISTIDNILKPKIIGSRANIHPALVLLGVIGGLDVFGLIGVVVGPIVLAFFVTALDTVLKERSSTARES